MVLGVTALGGATPVGASMAVAIVWTEVCRKLRMLGTKLAVTQHAGLRCDQRS